MGELNAADRQVYMALRRLMLKIIDMIEVRLELEPSTSDIRKWYKKQGVTE
jgi:hypothetical protein